MLTEISLNILDVTENSTKAGATLVKLTVSADTARDRLVVVIDDNGCGMDEEQVKRVIDPFYTTRKTRRVGLGVPFFKMSAEVTGGSFDIKSRVGEGTVVTAEFVLSSIDRMPMGDLASTVHQLITQHPDTDFLFSYSVDCRGFTLDTVEMREILGGIPLQSPEVSEYLRDYLKENILETNGKTLI